ncbi:MAG: ComEC/Rec2 family competence protein [Phycisphaerae bacterium]
MVQLVTPSEEDFRLWTPPMFLPVLAFLGGIAFDQYLTRLILPVCILIPISVLGYLIWRKKTRVSFWLLMFLAFAGGMVHHYQANHLFPAHHIRNFVREDSSVKPPVVTLTARVLSSAMINQAQKTFPYQSKVNIKTRFLADVEQITIGETSSPTAGLVEISIPGMFDQYHPGQEIKAHGRLVSTKFPRADFPLPSNFNYYENNRIFTRLLANSAQDITMISNNKLRVESILERARQTAQGLLMRNELPAGEYASGLLTAVVLGNRYHVQNEVNQAMINIGAAHMLAVSGFNLAMLAAGLWWVCSVTGVSRKATTIIVIFSALVFTTLTDFQPSIVRAMIMIVIVCFGSLFNKPANILNSLAVAALVLLLLDPNQLFNPGFQLSFTSTLGLVVLAGPIYHFFFVPIIPQLTDPNDPRLTNHYWLIWNYSLDKFKILFCASIAAGLGALPLVMHHFNILSLIGPVTSVVLCPLVTLLTLTGFAQMILALAVPAIGLLLAHLNNFLCGLMGAISMFLAKLPGVYVDVPPPAWYLVFLYFGVIFYSLLGQKNRPFKTSWRKPVLLVLIAVYLAGWISTAQSKKSWVYVAGGSEGQMLAVHTGRELVFIDCGASRSGKVAEFARQVSCQFFSKPAAVILTSPDQQFFNDLWSLADQNPRLEVFLPSGFNERLASGYEPVKKLLADPALHKQTISTGAEIRFRETKLTVLYPPSNLPAESTENDAVILVHSGKLNIIVASKLNSYAANAISRNFKNVRADVLILNAITTPGTGLEEFLAQLHPQKLIVTGHLTLTKSTSYRQLAKKYTCELIEPSKRGGYVVEDKN